MTKPTDQTKQTFVELKEHHEKLADKYVNELQEDLKDLRKTVKKELKHFEETGIVAMDWIDCGVRTIRKTEARLLTARRMVQGFETALNLAEDK